jgi:hypothetical protein
MKLTPKINTPPQLKSISCLCDKFINVQMLIVKRQDQEYFWRLELERHIHKINAGFVLTTFEQASLEKMETHAMIADINDMIEQFKLHEARDQSTPENTPE